MNFSASEDYCGNGRFVQHAVIARYINRLELGPGDTVLDVGCGTGEETKSIAGKVKSVTGTDASEEMLAVAVETNSAPNITYRQWDARAVGDNPDWRGRFDKVVCFFVLHWFPEGIQALRSISACLKPGGQALFIFGGQYDNCVPAQASSFLKGHARWGAYLKDFKSPVHLWTNSEEETEIILTENGYAKGVCEMLTSENTLNESTWKVTLKTCLGESALIPEEALDDYLRDLWQWALGRYGDKSQPGLACMPMRLMVVHAWK